MNQIAFVVQCQTTNKCPNINFLILPSCKYIILCICTCLQPNSNLFYSLRIDIDMLILLWLDLIFFLFRNRFYLFTSHQWKLPSIGFKYLISFWDDKLEFFFFFFVTILKLLAFGEIYHFFFVALWMEIFCELNYNLMFSFSCGLNGFFWKIIWNFYI